VPFATIKSNIALIRNPLSRKMAIMLTEEQFNFGFNEHVPARRRQSRQRAVTPCPVHACARSSAANPRLLQSCSSMSRWITDSPST
jgi:hypothetical protein